MFKAFTDLSAEQPVEYEHLLNAIRESCAGSDFMSFLQSIPGRSISSASLLRFVFSLTMHTSELNLFFQRFVFNK